MCGIIGYAGGKNAAEEVFAGLKKLEYRGYDSAGISVLTERGIETYKRSGRVDGLKDALGRFSGNAGIGHTRWATHGKPTDANAHPHCAGVVAVAHNGMIDNYDQLKRRLTESGARFLSDTDSEVAAHLLDRYYRGEETAEGACADCANARAGRGGACECVKKRLLAAVKKTAEQLKGSYALVVLCTDFDGVVAVKYKSPIIVGLGCGENYIASDVPALPPSVEKIFVPEDGDIVVVTRSGAECYDGELRRVNRVASANPKGSEDPELRDCPHYMLKEIFEDERTVRATAERFPHCNLARIAALLNRADRVVLTGCGTAYNSCLLGKYYFESAGLDCRVGIASELRYFPPAVTENTVVFAVSQSGETADTVEAASLLKSQGATVVAVTNVAYSAVTRLAHLVLPVCAGSEICVAATKSYLGQVACLYLVAALKAGTVGQAFGELRQIGDCVGATVRRCSAFGGGSRTSAGDAPSECGKSCEKIAAQCAKSSAVFFLGRGTDYAVAVEGSLKLKEVSYVFSDAYPAGELKHGTLALVDEDTLSIVVICEESVAEKCENAVEQIMARRGKTAVVTTLDGVAERMKEKADDVLYLPCTGAKAAPFVCAAALQLIAYRTAVLCGHDPDKPRNLAKSVTVE